MLCHLSNWSQELSNPYDGSPLTKAPMKRHAGIAEVHTIWQPTRRQANGPGLGLAALSLSEIKPSLISARRERLSSLER
jgi:hypothetical protein